MKQFKATVLLFLSLSCVCFAQGVKISDQPGSPHQAAGLELDFSNRGFLMSRLTQAERDSIVAPPVGLQIFNTSTQCFEGYFSSGWRALACECNAPPGAPSQISGPQQFCAGVGTSIYSINVVPDADSYLWQISGDAQLVSGQGTTSVTVQWGSQAGSIKVKAQNACGLSDSSLLTFSPSPVNAAFTISGTASVNAPFTINGPSGYATYTWFANGASPSSGATQNVSTTWTQTGTYTVSLVVTDANGCSDSSSQSVTVLNCPPSGSQTFSFTGIPQVFVVPACKTSLQITCFGAQGASPTTTLPGLGGQASATVPVTPGETLYVYVGGQGQVPQGGWNGGGNGYNFSSSVQGGGGGGASDVRRAGSTLNDRIIVAGGGGGTANAGCGYCDGGGGGGTSGVQGVVWDTAISGPGTQTSGGQAGLYSCSPSSTPGTFGQGGNGGMCSTSRVGPGGGGGWYGGGGVDRNSGASGGSGYVNAPGNSNTSMQTGVRSGNGEVTISW
jgi:hypothetical protein